MPLPTGDVIGLMVDNLERRKTVFPISRRKAVRWARDLDIPQGGETVLYTGFMYQLLPYMISAVDNLDRVEDSFLSRFVGLGRFMNRFINVSAFMAMPSKTDVETYSQIIRNIATLLKHADVPFGYLYKHELYAGALAYDMGMDEAFRAHAQRVHGVLVEHGVRTLITIDPHTTNMLRSVYPNILEEYDIEVKSYIEVLARSGIEPLAEVDGEITVHDSCVYARYEDVIDEPRDLLRRAGYTVRDPDDCGKLTHCCGGPVESIFPKVAHRVGEKRVTQLREAGEGSVATMCPICMASLKKAAGDDLEIDDLSTYLVRAFCNGGGTAREDSGDVQETE